MNKVSCALLSGFMALAGCVGEIEDHGAEMVGEARAALSAVPAGVGCLQLSVDGNRSVTKSFDVTAGQSQTLTMRGLPVGSVFVSGAAFAGACAQTAGKAPTWVSDPTPATLVEGTLVDVAVVLRRNGGANVGVDFEDTATPQTGELRWNTGTLIIGVLQNNPQTVNLTNFGAGPTGTISLTLQGRDPGAFRLSHNCSGTEGLASKATCTVTVTRDTGLLDQSIRLATLVATSPKGGSATVNLQSPQ